MKRAMVLAPALLLVSGCADILSTVSSGTGANKLGAPTKRTVDQAKEKGDYAAVQEICEKDQKASSEVHNYACETGREMQRDSFSKDDNCDTIVSRFHDASLEGIEQYTDAGIRFAKCGHYDAIFEELAHLGDNSLGTQILIRVEDSGVPLKTEFVSYMQQKPGNAFLEMKGDYKNYAAEHIGNWLLKKNYRDMCKPLVGALTGAPETISANLLFYFSDTKCKEATPLAVELLASDSATYRKWACQELANFGDKSVIPQLEIVAESDSAYDIVEKNRIYYVRDACKATIGKLKLKGK